MSTTSDEMYELDKALRIEFEPAEVYYAKALNSAARSEAHKGSPDWAAAHAARASMYLHLAATSAQIEAEAKRKAATQERQRVDAAANKAKMDAMLERLRRDREWMDAARSSEVEKKS